jgi:hypothetical protein
MTPYLSIGFILSPVDCFGIISGSTPKHMPRNLAERRAPRLMTCKFFNPCPNLMNVSPKTHDRANTMPRWRDFNHFSAYLSVDFMDGSKWEDMSKVCHKSIH